MTFEQFDRDFPSDDACKEYIVAKRWPDGVRCPRCNRQEKVYALKASFRWTCCNADCGGRKGYRFSVTTGTIFQDTKVSLRLWFKIGYLMLTAKKGMSSLQIRRVIFGENSGTDWRTAWYICHRWRAAMRGDAFPLRGIVGTYHNVSADYLPLYLNEFSFRHNNRKNPDAFGAMITTCRK